MLAHLGAPCSMKFALVAQRVYLVSLACGQSRCISAGRAVAASRVPAPAGAAAAAAKESNPNDQKSTSSSLSAEQLAGACPEGSVGTDPVSRLQQRSAASILRTRPAVEAASSTTRSRLADRGGVEQWESMRYAWLATGDPTPGGDVAELRAKLSRLRSQQRRRTVTVNKAAVLAALRDPGSPCSFTKNLPLPNLVALYEELWVEEGVQPL